MRLRMLVVTVAAAIAVLFLMPVAGEDSDPPRCTSPFGTRTACDTAGQNLALVGAFAAVGLVWWLSGTRKLPPLFRR